MVARIPPGRLTDGWASALSVPTGIRAVAPGARGMAPAVAAPARGGDGQSPEQEPAGGHRGRCPPPGEGATREASGGAGLRPRRPLALADRRRQGLPAGRAAPRWALAAAVTTPGHGPPAP